VYFSKNARNFSVAPGTSCDRFSLHCSQ
jgi:hypothetical protein